MRASDGSSSSHEASQLQDPWLCSLDASVASAQATGATTSQDTATSSGRGAPERARQRRSAVVIDGAERIHTIEATAKEQHHTLIHGAADEREPAAKSEASAVSADARGREARRIDC